MLLPGTALCHAGVLSSRETAPPHCKLTVAATVLSQSMRGKALMHTRACNRPGSVMPAGALQHKVSYMRTARPRSG